jgi:hypothetical protein
LASKNHADKDGNMKINLAGTNKFISIRCYRKFKMYGHWWGIHGQLYINEKGKTVASKQNYLCSCYTGGAYVGGVCELSVAATFKLAKQFLIKKGKNETIKAITHILKKQKTL